MSGLAHEPRLDRARDRLSPYLGRLLERAAGLALDVHADAVSVEHLLGAAMRDEDSAANQTVVFAFADPETVLQELLALCPGIMVVGSSATRPFSSRAVEALARARSRAAVEGSADVTLEQLCDAAESVLPQAQRAKLAGAGWRSRAGVPVEPAQPAPPEKKLAEASKQALSRAARAAGAAAEASIGPARILVACLQGEPGIGTLFGVSGTRARLLLEGAFLDTSSPTERELPVEPSLLAFLDRLPKGAGSLDLLSACHHESTPELHELLGRHKLTPELLARAAGNLTDPD